MKGQLTVNGKTVEIELTQEQEKLFVKTQADIQNDINKADRLMSNIRNFAIDENAKAEIELDWIVNMNIKYSIWFSYYNNQLVITSSHGCKELFQIYFATEYIANKALETFKDELTWYFTEYKDHL